MAEPPQEPGAPPYRFRKRRDGPVSDAVAPLLRPGLFVPWIEWIRTQPFLAGAVLVFCLTAVGGLVLSVPPGFLSSGGSTRAPVEGPDPLPTSSPAAPAEPSPASEAPAPSSWVVKPASEASALGLALVYAYRALPPGGDSRFEWYVQIQGPPSILEQVDEVRWR